MWIFSRRSDVELELIKQKIITLESKLIIMESSLANMRGIINRKLGGFKDEKKKETSNPTDSIFLGPDGLEIN